MRPITTKPKKYTYFIGIDVSRNKLDFAVCQEKTLLFHEVITNERSAVLGFIDRLKALPGFRLSKAVFCMENTGFYCNHLLNSLSKLKASIVHDNPHKISRSIGLSRGKDDKTDAIRIAEYAWKNRDELILWAPRRDALNEIASLLALRNRLLGVAISLKTPEEERKSFISKKAQEKGIEACKESIQAITADLFKTEQGLKSLINSDEHLARLMEVITSVPYVGFYTALQIIICTNEYKDITDPKKFACYSGIAPFPRESGLIVRKRRISHMANKKMKSLLHLCAISAAYRDDELKIYFERKLKEGKPKMSILNAVRYKLILRVFACLNQDRCYVKNYVRHETQLSGTGDCIEKDGKDAGINK